ncbi:hydroxymethylglutaryl-CoA synthase family protein [Mesorhizobium australicum]|uniref:3-hydroxy-3-methylglutaryl CoA synthase n=1 Tax=Mesorhizobium australicum TaxID=536018 RepID=A0A1X7PTD9_9HYPH|nr:hydroxymethylglutaryl-CoA synthase family protein [Mesorhizobium australicum]SMH54640.1 3-hydroxy-3-methylglutaryl CoA synthase [Mesorhizobium australicum]
MAQASLISVSGYLPLLRFDRKVARGELRWSGLGGSGRGRRAVAGWDEDPLTMAVEAARALDIAGRVDGVVFASTSSPFNDRSMASLVIEATRLPASATAQDVGNSRRAAVTALLKALRSGVAELVVAGEKRMARPGSSQHLNWGDGAGAALVGTGDGLAKLLGAATVNADLLDIFTEADHGLPYGAEDRFVRDEAVEQIYIPAVKAALADAGTSGADIAIAVLPETVDGTYKAVAKACGLTCANVCTEIVAQAGDLGAALPLFGLALALDRAEPGAKILLAGFGNGADVLVLEATGKGSGKAADQLKKGVALTSYSRLLNLTGMLDMDWGPRAEVNQKVAASTLLRHGREMHGFIGGRDRKGNVQFPKTPVPVRPDATGPEEYDDVPLSEVAARVVSITADRLNFTPDPPFYFGLVQFQNGARVAMEHCDIEGRTPEVGDPVRMRFRVKAIDRQRHFRTYFWKAAPVSRPDLPVEA